MTKKEKFFIENTSGVGSTTINFSGYGYGRHYAGMINLYGYDPDGNVFDYIVTYHRSKVICKMISTGEWWKLDESILANYSTNGHTTRVGIKRANIAKAKKMKDSHDAIPFSGKAAHDARVFFRNN